HYPCQNKSSTLLQPKDQNSVCPPTLSNAIFPLLHVPLCHKNHRDCPDYNFHYYSSLLLILSVIDLEFVPHSKHCKAQILLTKNSYGNPQLIVFLFVFNRCLLFSALQSLLDFPA